MDGGSADGKRGSAGATDAGAVGIMSERLFQLVERAAIHTARPGKKHTLAEVRKKRGALIKRGGDSEFNRSSGY